MDLIIASSNAHKISEISAITPSTIRVISMRDIGILDDIPETSSTLEGNALQKSRYIYDLTGRDCFADDTGLEVDALGGAPGVLSARYASSEGFSSHDSAANMSLLLSNLEGVENRRARFRTVISLIMGGREHLFEGIVNGRIVERAVGLGGFGYDPIFVPDGYVETFAQMSLDVKNGISHRSRAVHKLVDYLKELL